MNNMDAKLAELREIGVKPELVDNIKNFIEHSIPANLVKISPFRLAMEWNEPAYEALDAFLYGTRLGIFDLEWDIKCPSCKGSTQLSSNLGLLKPQSHCNYCRIDISGGFDDAVEVTFRVNENIRSLGDIPVNEIIAAHNIGEDMSVFKVEPGASVERKLTLSRGTWHMFKEDYGCGAPLLLRGDTEKRSEPQAVEFLYEGGVVSRGNEYYAPGDFVVRLVNRDRTPIELIFMRAREFPWVSGAVVASSQIFRDLFSSELIASDESFSVRNISFVFTDIKGSTAMYERLGDSNAYYLVKEHFKIMKDVVSRHHGSVVKTIGDAIMASFTVSTDAVNAVLDMQDCFSRFNYENKERDDIIIKVGIHRGPCLAVTSNDRLDYFGRTVNIAARVQGLSEGSDIVLSGAVYHETGIGDLIDPNSWTIESRQASLKGIDGLYEVAVLLPKQ